MVSPTTPYIINRQHASRPTSASTSRIGTINLPHQSAASTTSSQRVFMGPCAYTSTRATWTSNNVDLLRPSSRLFCSSSRAPPAVSNFAGAQASPWLISLTIVSSLLCIVTCTCSSFDSARAPRHLSLNDPITASPGGAWLSRGPWPYLRSSPLSSSRRVDRRH